MLEIDDGKDGPIERNTAEEWFIEEFGVPFSWAVQMAQMDSPLGHAWLERLEHLNDGLDKKPAEGVE